MFVVGGGTLSITNNGMIDANGVVSGGSSGASDAGLGQAVGGGFFLQGSGTLAFSPAQGKKLSMGDSIADETGSGIAPPSGYSAHFWNVSMSGAGQIDFTENDSTGTTTINSGIVLDNSIAGLSHVQVASAGTLGGLGLFASVLSSGTLVPGSSAFPQTNFAVEGGLTLQSGVVSCFHVGGSPAHSSSITVSFDGTSPSTLPVVVRVDFAVTPAVGNNFTIIQNGTSNNTLSGTFGGLAIGPPNVDGKLSYSPTAVSFTVTAIDGIFRGGFDGGINAAACASIAP